MSIAEVGNYDIRVNRTSQAKRQRQGNLGHVPGKWVAYLGGRKNGKQRSLGKKIGNLSRRIWLAWWIPQECSWCRMQKQWETSKGSWGIKWLELCCRTINLVTFKEGWICNRNIWVVQYVYSIWYTTEKIYTNIFVNRII